MKLVKILPCFSNIFLYISLYFYLFWSTLYVIELIVPCTIKNDQDLMASSCNKILYTDFHTEINAGKDFFFFFFFSQHIKLH